MNFTIEFKRPITNGSRFTYATANGTVEFDENGTPINLSNFSIIRNTVHKVKVENFTGIFMFMRGRFFKGLMPNTHWFLIPARGFFGGYCDKITFLPVVQ